MQVKRTLRLHDVSIRDFLADLNLQTGIRFFADRSVAEDRLTLFAHDRPLAETLRAVAAFFRFEWRRNGLPDDYGYTLRQSDAARKREETILTTRAEEAADLIVEEVAAFERHEGLTDEQLKGRADEAARQLRQEKDPARQRALAIEYDVCEQLRGQSEWRRLVNKFLRTLSRDQLVVLMRAGSTDYAWPTTVGCKDIPLPVVQAIRHAERTDDISAVLDLRDIDFILLHFSGELGRRPTLKWQMTLGRRDLRNYRSSGFGSLLPSVSLPFDSAAPVSDEPPNWRSDPAFLSRVTIRLPPEEADALTAQEPRTAPRLTLGRVLDELDRARPTNMIADAFWTTALAGFAAQDMPLGEALTSLARMTSHRWWRQDGFVMFQSTNYAADRRSEPPATAVARWTDRANRGLLEMEDCAEIAALPDPQFNALLQMSLRGAFPEQVHLIQQARVHLALWNALTRAQRRRARAEGIPYTELTRAQQALYLRAASDQTPSPSSSRRRGQQPWSPQILAESRFRINVRESRQWGIRREGNPLMVNAATREEAVRQFQQGDPSVRPEEIREIVSASILFLYEHERGLLARGWFSMPTRWIESGD